LTDWTGFSSGHHSCGILWQQGYRGRAIVMDEARDQEDLAPVLSALEKLDPRSLLRLYTAVMRQLMKQRVIRSFNSPVGDVGERIACEELGLELAVRSVKGYDALSQNGQRYQIKTRWRGARGWRNLSGIRDLDEHLFDTLAVVILGNDLDQAEQLLCLPYAAVREYARDTTRGFKRMVLSQELMSDSRVTWIKGCPTELTPTSQSAICGQIKKTRSTVNAREGAPLHDVILSLLTQAGGPLPIPEVYDRIVSEGLYRQLDGGPVSRQQVYARIGNYPRLFVVDRTRKPALVSVRTQHG
jgi:hypothetical protein